MDTAEFEAALLDGQASIDLQDIHAKLRRWQVLLDAIACRRTSAEV